MLRNLLIIAIPCASLMADWAPATGQRIPAAPQVEVARVPFVQYLEKTKAEHLAQVREQAESGDLEAQARLGVMYYWGEGAPVDWDQAKIWLRKASERGHADAQAKLGAMFFLGQGGPRDLAESLKWFRAAAEQGEPYAEGCMGVMYAVGEGVPRDLLQAYVWLLQAQAGGDTDAAEPFQQVKSHLSEEQIRLGNSLAAEAMKNREQH
jgi:hypothetical protein